MAEKLSWSELRRVIATRAGVSEKKAGEFLSELQKQIIGNNTIVESEDDEDIRGAKVYFVDETGDGEPEYVLLITRDEIDQELSVVVTYPSAWD